MDLVPAPRRATPGAGAFTLTRDTTLTTVVEPVAGEARPTDPRAGAAGAAVPGGAAAGGAAAGAVAPWAVEPGAALPPGTGDRGDPGTAERWLRSALGGATGYPLPPAPPYPSPPGATPPGIRLLLTPSLAGRLGPEGYRLRASPEALTLTAATPTGLFWAAQTLRQLLGADAHRRAPVGRGPWTVPAVDIEDAPRLRWRGCLLDVARHFMPTGAVLRMIDLLAAHKLNVLHLHLTDDQGWRVEIRRHPRLTEVGSWRHRTMRGYRGSGGYEERPHGGYYTQDDLREIVAYAAERHITVVPEIDVPGHSQAAIAAYPELGNTDVVDTAALRTGTDWGIVPNVLGVSDGVLRFYEDVLEEVLEIFPSRYVHLGGDECVKDQWRASAAAQARIAALGLDGRDGREPEEALQSWFVRHFADWLAARGRRMVGWDEILDGGPLAEGAVVSSWRGYAGGIAAAVAGHDVVICPEQQVYLDHRQAPGEEEPIPVGYVRTLEDVYRFEPVPPALARDPALAARVMGAQANIWTEFLDSPRAVDYAAFPRLAAFAEVVWSPLREPADRDVAEFRRRMETHYRRLDALGVEYRHPDGPRPWQRRPGIAGRPIDGPPPER
ncbi:beta-N-acetylhexosaminidase [Allostreptomyces psammosilenae]|uniref:beta-N-acetylhexosaminidase n=1 Tax=Allostreptomyces psammosilenae TaxID=1892865 RepID=A0A852ZYD5_9ACTN|nr:beta-N-acetylhexosaminidase [Allostreptomyces psammosilenae]NYI06240.1 hexosaminidase [Allostreptomyces psammosilenae]